MLREKRAEERRLNDTVRALSHDLELLSERAHGVEVSKGEYTHQLYAAETARHR